MIWYDLIWFDMIWYVQLCISLGSVRQRVCINFVPILRLENKARDKNDQAFPESTELVDVWYNGLRVKV